MLLCVVSCSIWFAYPVASQKVDLEFLRDYYSHSQWSMPLSTRIIGDGDLYLLAGTEYVQGASVFSINPEVPPFGKYLLGLSVLFFDSYFPLTVFVYVATIVVLFFLAKRLFQNNHVALLVSTFGALSPTISGQLDQSMLDGILLLLFLLYLLSLLAWITKKEKQKRAVWGMPILSGILLGLTTATKFPVFLPAFVLVPVILLIFQRRFLQLILLVLAAGMTYVATFAPFIISHSPFEWLKNELWTFNFYRSSKSSIPKLVVLPALLFGKYFSPFHQTYLSAVEWSLLWPIGLLALILSPITSYFKTSSALKLIFFTAVLLLIELCFLPFFPRYLILLEPLLVLLLLAVLRSIPTKFSNIFLALATVILLIQWFSFWHPPVSSGLDQVKSLWEGRQYRDLYSKIFSEQDLDRISFAQAMSAFTQDAGIINTNVIFKAPETSISRSAVPIQAYIQYDTRFGSFVTIAHTHALRFGREWKLIWPKDMGLPGYTFGETSISLVPPAEKSIYSKDGVLLAKTVEQPLLAIPNTASTSAELDTIGSALNLKTPELEKYFFDMYRDSQFIQLPLQLSPEIEKELAPVPIRKLQGNSESSISPEIPVLTETPTLYNIIVEAAHFRPPFAGKLRFNGESGPKELLLFGTTVEDKITLECNLSQIRLGMSVEDCK